MAPIATYVFLDLETTGLPKLDNNKTRITELSMVVVKRRHLLDTRPGAVPRVLDKLSMCFNPGRMIHPDSTEITGLNNDLLEHNTLFNLNVFNTINSFLQCLEKPVCLVSENGHSFDFPILKNHFEKLGVQLPDDILCGDSLYSFYDILEPSKGAGSTEGNKLAIVNVAENGDKEKEVKLCDPSREASPKCEEQSANVENSQSEELITEDVMKHFDECDDLKFQQIMKEQNNRTPEQKPIRQTLTKIKKVKRRIFFENKPKPTRSYKLKDIYERVLNRPANEAHRAENDCLMAMEISISMGRQFVEYLDTEKNQCKFSEIKAMTPGVPLGD
ncbi:uncharacterized protein LOC111350997 [Spodoptera litura]|uniref:Uncharacterized protein LOC111350997 n=1 Tax=Spodoptera litura TaxID=69820 RepID=A0A9J7DYT4_SPOLT|nr:uncharacterized protein LOC111350997 [Spodoptera litura]